MTRLAVAIAAVLTGACWAMGGCTLDRSGLGTLLSTGGADGGDDDAAVEVPSPCMCGPCQRCVVDGVCEIDPASRWQVFCVSAGIANSAPSGDSWDPANAATGAAASGPDPYCQFDLDAAMVAPGSTGLTPSQMDTFTPNWNQLIIPGGQTISAAELMSATGKWLLTIGDDDGCVADMGCFAQPICQLTPPMDASWLSNGLVTLQSLQSCRTLTIQLVCSQP